MDNVNQSNVNEMTTDTLTIIIYMAIALYISFSLFVIILSRADSVRLKSKLGKIEVEKLENDKQYIAEIKQLTESNKSLKWSSDFNQRETERLKTALGELNQINQSLVKSNDEALKEFENFVRLYADRNGVELEKSEVKRSVTSLKDKECIRIGEGDWAKLAPLFEEAGIVWHRGQKASDIIPETGYCVSINYFGENELTQDTESEHILDGFTVLPASDFIDETKEIEDEPAIDWSKMLEFMVAFPYGYEIPKGKKIRAIRIKDSGHIKVGALLTIEGDGSSFPKVYFDDISNLIGHNDMGKNSAYSHIYCLAPLNPTDHPNHPDHEKRN